MVAATTQALRRRFYIAEIVCADSDGVQTTLRFTSNNGYIDSDGNHYAPRLRQPLHMAVSCFGGSKTHGQAPVGYGLLELDNSEGALDYLRGYAFDGYAVTVSYVYYSADDDAYYAVGLFDGTADQPQVGIDSVKLRLRTWMHALDAPAQTVKFAGTNALPDGLEGTAADLKGKPKPLVLGYVFGWTPPCVNTSRLIYQIHTYKLRGPWSYAVSWSIVVYDKAALLTQGAEKTLTQMQSGATTKAFTADAATDQLTVAAHGYASGTGLSVLADALSTLPGGLSDSVTYYTRTVTVNTLTLHPTKADALAGTNTVDITSAGTGTFTISDNRTALGNWDYCNDSTGGCFIRLGSRPEGTVTVDVVNPEYHAFDVGALYTPTGITKSLYYYGSLAESALSESSSNKVRAAASEMQKMGIVIDTDRTVLSVLEEVLEGCGYFVASANMASALAIGNVGYNTNVGYETPTFLESDIFEIEPVVTEDPDRGVPVWRVTLYYKKNYTPLSPDQIATSVSTADVAALGEEWRVVTASDATVKTQYPTAREIVRYSLTTDATEADTEALRILNQYKVRRDIYRIKVSALEVLTTMHLYLGWRCHVTYPRFDLSAGAYFWALALDINAADDTVDVLIWK